MNLNKRITSFVDKNLFCSVQLSVSCSVVGTICLLLYSSMKSWVKIISFFSFVEAENCFFSRKLTPLPSPLGIKPDRISIGKKSHFYRNAKKEKKDLSNAGIKNFCKFNYISIRMHRKGKKNAHL